MVMLTVSFVHVTVNYWVPLPKHVQMFVLLAQMFVKPGISRLPKNVLKLVAVVLKLAERLRENASFRVVHG